MDDNGELPEGWASALVPDVCELNPLKPKAADHADELLVTFVPMPAVDADAGAITKPQLRPFSEVRKGFTAFREEDVILAKITPCMENGKAAVARGLSNGLGFGSTEFHVFRSNRAVLPDYLFHFLRQESFRTAAEKEMTGSVGQKRVPTEYLEQVELPLPPLAEQRRIVAAVEAVLAKVNAARERLNRVPAILKRFRRAVLSAACSGRLTADWREQNAGIESAAAALTRLELTPLADDALPDEPEAIPSSWRWVRFGELVSELRNGLSPRPSQTPPGNPILRINAVRPCEVLFTDLRYMPDSDEQIATYALQDRDLLFTRYNGSLELLGVCGMVRGLTGRVMLYPDKLMRVRFTHSEVLPEYCELFFSEPAARERMIEKAKSSAGQNGISGADVKAQPFALPPLAEQQEIVRRVDKLFALADVIESRLTDARRMADQLTQAVLAKAFRGELVPTEAELARREGRSYESAAELLARIRAERQQPVPPTNDKPKRTRKPKADHA